jgi:predicted amidohydrolase YtcJ
MKIRDSLLVLCFCLASVASAADGPITVFTAKKFITMDPSLPEANAVAVQDGKILSVGRDMDDLQPWLKGRDYKVDETLKDKIVLPGFIEAHGHPLLGGLLINFPLVSYLPTSQPYGPDFPGVRTMEDATALMKRYVAESKDSSAVVFIWGWDVVAMGGRHLDKTFLDGISSTRPVIVWDASEHFAYANTLAMTKVGIKDDAVKVNGVQAGPDGKPNGQFLGVEAAQQLLQPALAPYMVPDKALPRMRSILDLSNQSGITTQSELVLGAFNLGVEEKLIEALFNDPAARTRGVVVIDTASATAAKKDGAIAYVQAMAGKSTDQLIYNGVKFFSDDSFVGLGMVMTNPGYADARKGIYVTQPADLAKVMLPWWKAGLQIHIHSNGNGGNESTLNALAQLQGAYPRFDHRFTIEHFGSTTPEMATRLKALGGVASVNPYYVHYRAEFNAPMLGTDRAYTAARLKTLLDAGNIISLHSDTPVGPARPLEWAWIAVNRFGLSGKVLAPAERVSVDQALRMITINAAYTLGIEKKAGSIQTGKFADFAVLEQDPYAVDPTKLRDIPVWGTVVGGRLQPASAIRPQPGLRESQ